jgi:flagellar biosynthesis/type III secretory pathway M-ring protein FliF/YscJ
MPTWSWIIIGIAAALVIVLAVVGTRFLGRRRVERRRAEARVLRQEAEERAHRAEEREALAGDIANQAREERKEADKLARRAGKLDPGPDRGRREDKAKDRPKRRLFSR